MVVSPDFLEWMVLFWIWVCLQRDPQGPRSLGGTFQCSRDVAEGPEGPVGIGGSFQLPNIAAKGPQGPRLLWGLHLRLVSALAGLQDPRVLVSCQDLWGLWPARARCVHGVRLEEEDVSVVPAADGGREGKRGVVDGAD